MGLYHQASRALQDRFDTRRLADRIDERIVHEIIDEDDRASSRAPTCSSSPQRTRRAARSARTRAVSPGSSAWSTRDDRVSVLRRQRHVPDHRQRAGQPEGRAPLDRLRGRQRMRLNGVAAIADDDPLLAEDPEAQLVSGSRRPRSSELSALHPRVPARPSGRGSSRAKLSHAGAGVEDAGVASDVVGGRIPRVIPMPKWSSIAPRVFASRRLPDRVRAELERSFELEVHDRCGRRSATSCSRGSRARTG